MNTALIIHTAKGWTIYPPNESRPVGSYASRHDAEQVCSINGWEVLQA